MPKEKEEREREGSKRNIIFHVYHQSKKVAAAALGPSLKDILAAFYATV